MHKIKPVDPTNSKIVQQLAHIMHETLPGIPFPSGYTFYWWGAFDAAGNMIGCACLSGSDRYEKSGYFARVGVLDGHRGRGLQRRFMRTAEAKAKKLGWTDIYSDTTNKVHSAANFEKAGYVQVTPEKPWGWANTKYWRKQLV